MNGTVLALVVILWLQLIFAPSIARRLDALSRPAGPEPDDDIEALANAVSAPQAMATPAGATVHQCGCIKCPRCTAARARRAERAAWAAAMHEEMRRDQ
jgi:cob(I)alamin adenosyltransferase